MWMFDYGELGWEELQYATRPGWQPSSTDEEYRVESAALLPVDVPVPPPYRLPPGVKVNDVPPVVEDKSGKLVLTPGKELEVVHIDTMPGDDAPLVPEVKPVTLIQLESQVNVGEGERGGAGARARASRSDAFNLNRLRSQRESLVPGLGSIGSQDMLVAGSMDQLLSAYSHNQLGATLKPSPHGKLSEMLSLSDVWIFDIMAVKWSKDSTNKVSAAPVIPSPRWLHSAVVDGASMVVFGGCKASLLLSSEVWSYKLDTGLWERVKVTSPSAPLPREGHTAVMLGKEMLVYGGMAQNYITFNDTWTLTGAVWKQEGDVKTAAPGTVPPGNASPLLTSTSISK